MARERIPSVLRRGTLHALVCLLPWMAIACSPSGEPNLKGKGPTPSTWEGEGGAGGEGGSGGAGGAEVACPEGATRECHVALGEHNGVVSCFNGMQQCVDGEWGNCVEPEKLEGKTDAPVGESHASPSGASEIASVHGLAPFSRLEDQPSLHTLAITNATACANNPCDPSCMFFSSGDVDLTLQAPGGDVDWHAGDPSSAPVLGDPCDEGSDCQGNTKCTNPVSGTCAHHKCVPGAPLTTGCDPCVTQICQEKPECCGTPYVGTCAHDPCVTGARLKNNCDPCVQSICAKSAYSSCCKTSGTWTAACAAAVSSVCGKTCVVPEWSDSCVEKVATKCNAECLNEDSGASCGHHVCYTGDKLSAGCDPCVAAICAADPSCCSTSWDYACIEKVSSVCGETCPGKGLCQPWLAGEKNPTCAGVDLTVAPTCKAGTESVLPICNHGNSAAPAGLPIAILPAASAQMPKDSPSLVGGSLCTTPSVIPAGKCVDVSCGNIAPGAQIMINPKGAPAAINECYRDNNWTVYDPSACGSPLCVASTAKATITKINLFFAVDRSGSMLTKSLGIAGQPTRWKQMTDAMKAFAQNAASAGTGVWVRFWPYNQNGTCPNSCSSTACATGNVALGTLTKSSAPSDMQEQAIISAIALATPASDGTPMYPALEGALTAAQTYTATHPTEQSAVVLMTDGEPTQCDTSIGNMALLAQTAYEGTGVRTFTIGIQGVAPGVLDQIAAAGNGATYHVGDGAGVPVESLVLQAIYDIKQALLPCTFPLDMSEDFDEQTVGVTFTKNDGSQLDLIRVSGAAACGPGGGYYMDDPLQPTAVSLCPSTCTAVQGEIGGRIDVQGGCPAHQPLSDTVSYQASCPPGQSPQWGYLIYEAATPDDSSIGFFIQTSDTDAFGAPPPTPVVTAKAGLESCTFAGPDPCPVDLSEALGGLPNSRRKYLQLKMDLLPSSSGAAAPTLHNWQVTYSCADSE